MPTIAHLSLLVGDAFFFFLLLCPVVRTQFFLFFICSAWFAMVNFVQMAFANNDVLLLCVLTSRKRQCGGLRLRQAVHVAAFSACPSRHVLMRYVLMQINIIVIVISYQKGQAFMRKEARQ